MKKKDIIEQLEYFKTNDEIEEAIKMFNELITRYPDEIDYYRELIDYLKVETTIAELQWDSFIQIIAVCDKAIARFLNQNILFNFYLEKLDALIFLMENNANLLEKSKKIIYKIFEILEEKYSKEPSLYIRKSHVEYYLGNTKQALFSINLAIDYSKDNIEDRMYIMKEAYLRELNLS